MDLFPWGAGGCSWQNCRERRKKIVFQRDRREGISLCKNQNGFSPFWKMSGRCSTQSSSWSSSLSLCSNNKCVYSKCRHLSECLGLVYEVHIPVELSRNTQYYCKDQQHRTSCPNLSSGKWPVVFFILPSILSEAREHVSECRYLTFLMPAHRFKPFIYVITISSTGLSLWLLSSLLCVIHPHFSFCH